MKTGRTTTSVAPAIAAMRGQRDGFAVIVSLWEVGRFMIGNAIKRR